MTLKLKILSFKGQPYIEEKDVLFDRKGGTIGRSEANVLILVDEENIISRRHASIEFKNGHYYLVDSSLAGTYIDDAIEPINNRSVPLVDGMKIKIGDYSIAVFISNEHPPFSSPIRDDPYINPASEVLDIPDSLTLDQNNLSDEDLHYQSDINGLFNSTERNSNSEFLSTEQEQDSSSDMFNSTEPDLKKNAGNISALEQLSSENNGADSGSDNYLLDTLGDKEKQFDQGLLGENISSLNDNFTPAQPVEKKPIPEQGVMPDDFNFEDLFSSVDSARHSATPKKIAEEPVRLANEDLADLKVNEDLQCDPVLPVETNQASLDENQQLLQAFLLGAQIEQADMDFKNPAEKMIRIGIMFRQFVESTVSVLRSRAEFKSLFRVSVTTIQKSDNNPLKFAVTTDDVLKHIINDGQGGFKKSVESIDEGFNDLLNHQLAMQAGVQASLNEILRQFDPENIAKQYAEGIVLHKKSKCWDAYVEDYSHKSESAIDDFFGDVFAQAYEEQMKQLKKQAPQR